jgi:predicted regulator of Ras-like GTPase activity (Roadblock/LC7/MglB family)/DNA-binding MarR family transcriptional regulator
MIKISVEDNRTGKLIKLEVEEHHIIKKIVNIVIEHMGLSTVEQRSYKLVLNGQELPTNITVKDAVNKFGLKRNAKLTLIRMTIGQQLMQELRTEPLTISQLSEKTRIEEPIIRTTINRLKEKGLIEETGLFIDRYKVYRITDKMLNVSVLLKMLMKIEGVKVVVLTNINQGIPISSILPEGVDENRIAAMTEQIIAMGERACLEMRKGSLNMEFIQGEHGILLIVRCGPDIFLTISFDATISNEQLFTKHFKTIDLIRNTIADLSPE